MNGIEILSSTQVLVEATASWTPVWITTGIVCGIFLLIFIIDGFDWQVFPYILVAGAIVGMILGAIVGEIVASKVYETQYEVLVSDDVSMNEFYEHYEVIDQEGKIYTVKEKTND